MDPMMEEQLDYGDEEYGGSQKLQYQGSGGAIPAIAEEEMMGEDDEYDDLYNDVNIGEDFMQTMQQRREPPVSLSNGGLLNQKTDGPGSATPQMGGQASVSIAGLGEEGKELKPAYGPLETEQKSGGLLARKGLEEGSGDFPEGFSHQGSKAPETVQESNVGNAGFHGNSAAPSPPKPGMDPKYAGGPLSLTSDSARSGVRNPQPVPVNQAVTTAAYHVVMNDNSRSGMGLVGNDGAAMLVVGDLHWWTTDAQLESVMSQYGRVKEIKFFEERASGKSKGYCQVEFYDATAAAACKEGMYGHAFNGRTCVVEYASPQILKQMGAAYTSRQSQAQPQQQGRRQMNSGMGRGGGWGGRGGQGPPNRGQGNAGPMRGRGAMGAKGMGGPGGGFGTGATGGPYGPAGGMMHPQGMMGAAFDPTYMGGGGPYGGFSGPAFPGMMPPFQAVSSVGLPGVAPHVNPAFFGRGMSGNAMGMMGGNGMEGHSAGMWTDMGIGGWTGEDHGRRTRESSYGGDDVAADYGYGEVNNERVERSNASREKERGSERDWSGSSERRYRDEREKERDRSDKERYREEKDRYMDHRQRDRDWDNEGDWDGGHSSSRSRNKSRTVQEEYYRSHSRDADYGKRRRLPSD
ncbi:cleavage and polyadenylation specificity factor subunit 6 [Phoenix dactylifera]|uniref:Cleavage and polyadenylation specificity factor subunit 6 n=1 Tax=Phoenix dactylifera TaxID=42345 RepID=A0A8B9ASF2_PHODC|nr:cleavage and polyadenylation specificity factor subunit 6-like [Phoenix dactylifera]XP_038989726.1 cleavage and polyadenylation specificity factor subunit 6 [Phoenix dactylifera]